MILSRFVSYKQLLTLKLIIHNINIVSLKIYLIMVEIYSAETLLRSFTDNLKFNKADISQR